MIANAGVSDEMTIDSDADTHLMSSDERFVRIPTDAGDRPGQGARRLLAGPANLHPMGVGDEVVDIDTDELRTPPLGEQTRNFAA